MTSLLGALVSDVSRSQAALDELNAANVAAHRAVLRALGGDRVASLRQLAAALEPPRLALTEASVECRFAVARGRSAGFDLRVLPLNLGFSIVHGIEESRTSTVRIDIVAQPQSS